ncbi:hypothetical protein MMC20_004909 [Loxospora ochrophaea]|nr:hypothetical protein [Loxospora ochrophaea]
MPRGSDYSDHVAASDNAIEAGETKAAGTSAEGPASAGVDRSGKAAPMPEGVQEMNDGLGSGGGSRGTESGKGNLEPTVDVEGDRLTKGQ